MPRFFFHVRDGVSAPDMIGTEMADVYAAQAEAVRFGGAVLAELGGKFWDLPEWRLEVCDALGDILFLLRVKGEEVDLPHAAAPDIR